MIKQLLESRWKQVIVLDVIILLCLAVKINFLTYFAAFLILGYMPGSVLLFKLLQKKDRITYYIVSSAAGFFVSLFILNIFYIVGFRFMLYVYAALCFILYNVFIAHKSMAAAKEYFSKAKFDKYHIFILIVIFFLVVLYLSTFNNYFNMTGNKVFQTGRFIRANFSLSRALSFLSSNSEFHNGIHYLDSLIMLVIHNLTGLPLVTVLRETFFIISILSVLLLILCVKELTGGNLTAMSLALFILLFDVGVTASLVGIVKHGLFDYYRFQYAATGCFSYINNAPMLIARLLIFAIVYLSVLVYREVPRTFKESKRQLLPIIVTALLIAISLKAKINLFFPMLVFLLSIVVLDFLLKRKPVNFVLIFLFSLIAGSPFLMQLFSDKTSFTSGASSLVVFDPLHYFDLSKSKLLTNLKFLDRLFSGTILDVIVFLLLISSFWYLIISLPFAIKNWLKKESLYAATWIACLSGVTVSYLFVQSAKAKSGNIFWFLHIGFYLLALVVPIWFAANSKSKLRKILKWLITFPLFISILYGYSEFDRFPRSNTSSILKEDFLTTIWNTRKRFARDKKDLPKLINEKWVEKYRIDFANTKWRLGGMGKQESRPFKGKIGLKVANELGLKSMPGKKRKPWLGEIGGVLKGEKVLFTRNWTLLWTGNSAKARSLTKEDRARFILRPNRHYKIMPAGQITEGIRLAIVVQVFDEKGRPVDVITRRIHNRHHIFDYDDFEFVFAAPGKARYFKIAIGLAGEGDLEVSGIRILELKK